MSPDELNRKVVEKLQEIIQFCPPDVAVTLIIRQPPNEEIGLVYSNDTAEGAHLAISMRLQRPASMMIN